MEAKNENTISEKELQKRLSDMRMGINCAEHDLIEDFIPEFIQIAL